MKFQNLLAAAILVCCGNIAFGQDADSLQQSILRDIDKTSGIYYSYAPPTAANCNAPSGYKPFYISAYLRHGMRWSTSKGDYERPLKLLEEAEKKGKLTQQGSELLKCVRIIAEDARDRYGDLMPMGTVQHRGIAKRMHDAYPEVFKGDGESGCTIYSYSTAVPRCILSMAAFDDQIKELEPRTQFICESTKRNQYFMCNTSGADRISPKDMQPLFGVNAQKSLNPSRFSRIVFNDTTYLNKGFQSMLMNSIFTIAGTLKARPELGISLYEYFTNDEMLKMWQQSNLWLYVAHGPSAQFADTIEYDARFLMQHIISCADSAIAHGGCAAHLRFGHDFAIAPLAAAMRIKDACTRVSEAKKVWQVWQNYNVSPMAANIQIIFYKRQPSDSILVRVLLNEREASLPISSKYESFYDWNDVKALWHKLIE